MKQFSKKPATALAAKIVAAEDKLTAYLKECFPKGARCEVFLMHGQVTPTKATIWGVEATTWGGQVRVEIDTAKPWSRQRIRSVSASDVVNVRPAPKVAAGLEGGAA